MFRFFAPLVIDGQNAYALLTVKNTEGNKVYSVELDEIKKLDDKVRILENKSKRIHSSSFGGSVEDVQDYVKAFFNVPQIVDENGEPMVVYHGTNAEFWEFDKEKAQDKRGRALGMGWGKGKFYFTISEAVAKSNGGRVVPAFLNVRNPVKAEDYEANIVSGEKRDESIEKQDKGLKSDGVDGIESLDLAGAVAVFEPNPIKSATENAGTYDAGNADIRFHIVGERGDAQANGSPFPLAPKSDYGKADVGGSMPVPFAGNKKTIIEAHAELFARIGALAKSLGGRVIDAFAGAGTYTVGLGALGALPKGSVLNEWAVSRYVMHKMLAKNPQGVAEAMRDLVKRFGKSEELKAFRNKSLPKQ